MASTLPSYWSPPNMEYSDCKDGIAWISEYFGDCVDNTPKLLGFSTVIISLCLWFMPLIPQMIENYRNKRAEGISVYFLLLWLVGDICNYVGATLVGSLLFQKLIAGYYIFSNVILLGQLLYYGWFTFRRAREGRPLAGHLLIAGFIVYVLTRGAGDVAAQGPAMTSGETDASGENASFWAQLFPSSSYVLAGFVIGPIAAACYIASRVAQIYHNISRQSCRGVSLAMLCILVADFSYPLGVLLQSTGWAFVARNAPWIVGYVVSGFFDCCLIWQYCHYGTNEPPAA